MWLVWEPGVYGAIDELRLHTAANHVQTRPRRLGRKHHALAAAKMADAGRECRSRDFCAERPPLRSIKNIWSMNGLTERYSAKICRKHGHCRRVFTDVIVEQIDFSFAEY